MKRVLVAGALSGLLILGTPALAFSADRGGNSHDSHSGKSGHSDNRGSHADNRSDRGDHGRHDRDGYRNGYYRDGYYYGDPYYYDGPYYYGGYQECHRDPSGSVTCEPYGGDYDPGGYNGGYPDPPPDPQYCSQPHSAHSARCPGDENSGSGGGGY
jgi:hypothetical protein